MSKASKFPDSQPFNINGKKNLTKKNSWWASPPFNNNQVNRKTKPV